VPCWTDAGVVTNEIFAYARSTIFAAAIVDVATELLSLYQGLFKSIAAIASVSVDAFSDRINTVSAWSTSMLLASINISALHIGCRVAEFTIGETFHKERGLSIKLTTCSVSRQAIESGSFLEVKMLA
jgi:hypothetical protein